MRAWDEFLALQEIDLGTEMANKWLKTLKVVRFDACNLYLEAKDSFQVTWFEEHIRQKIQTDFVNNNKKKIKVHLTVANTLSHKSKKLAHAKNSISKTQGTKQFTLNFDPLDPYCTFQHYIHAEKNALVEKLLRSLIDTPSSQYKELGIFNPIYIHGNPGTGKTHLLMATAQALIQKGFRVLYTNAETFTEHVVSSIRIGEMGIFRQAYRNSDVLIIDDVQFLSKKGATQEELFHTFNTLHLENKQMILSANCAPAELQSIEPRLVSRFEWGVVLNLVPLEREELGKVLKQKADFLTFPLHDKIIDFFLGHFTSGCKALIKALEALVLRWHLNGQSSHQSTNKITAPIAMQILQDLILEEKERILTPEKMIRMIAEIFGIKSEDITGKAKTRDCVFPRQLAMFMCRQKLKMPYTKIGELFSKDHSTVMTSVKLVQQGLDTNDKEVLSTYQSIQKKLDTNKG